jgi:hypothetical protein
MINVPFIKGLQLSKLFYEEAVKPILSAHFPGLIYSAARLDGGSDVLGYDTPQSRDHGWGPRLQLFLSEADYACCRAEIVDVLGEELPHEIHGYPTNFTNANLGDGWLERTGTRPIQHGVSVHTPGSFFVAHLGFDPAAEIDVVDWLACAEQRLRTVAAGRVFHDGLGVLEPARAKLHYYPRDVWLYLLAAQWRRIDQEVPFMARCGDVGDELGSRLLAARLVRELMRLGFLMERQYAPYSKWFGTAFAELGCAPSLTPILERVLNGQTWREREAHLSAAYEFMAEKHNALGLTPLLPARVTWFYDRPYRVINAGAFVDALRAAITDEAVRRLPPHLGGADQISDSTDVLAYPERFGRLRVLYQEE